MAVIPTVEQKSNYSHFEFHRQEYPKFDWKHAWLTFHLLLRPFRAVNWFVKRQIESENWITFLPLHSENVKKIAFLIIQSSNGIFGAPKKCGFFSSQEANWCSADTILARGLDLRSIFWGSAGKLGCFFAGKNRKLDHKKVN